MDPPQAPTQACHNCRRRRLKCDRSLPQCLKCIRNGQECLGYQRLFRWEPGVASRGKMAGMTFEKIAEERAKQENPAPKASLTAGSSTQQAPRRQNISPVPGALTNPLVQDLSHASRKYLSYFASDVCKDLVLYDLPQHNRFRELIPMTQQHPVLLHVIVANSALRMSNACQKFVFLDTTALPIRHRTSLLSFPSSSSSEAQRSESYNDALSAKQKALHLLQSALSNPALVDIDVTLAVVLLFIEFELIDSGRDNWTHHINGARKIIETLCGSNMSKQPAMSPLRSCLISNCLVFDIIGSTLARSISGDPDSADALTLLQDAEGNHCSSFPVALLQLIQTGAQISQPSPPSSPSEPSIGSKQQKATQLLFTAQSFDPLAWATSLQPHSPVADLELRTHIASAHRAAVCIYLSRILISLDTDSQPSHDLESLVAEVITHLSFIRPESPMFIATTWPAFIAGAETNDRARQEWVARRFQELWVVEPWGVIRNALQVLERLWIERSGEGDESTGRIEHVDWVGDLRQKGVDWLIL